MEQSRTRAWVIEAPGKKDAFRKALDEAGFYRDKIVATYGRLFDLPSDKLGFDLRVISDPGDHGEITWEPKRKQQIAKLATLLRPVDELVIATDSDLEGELIASQVHAVYSAVRGSSASQPIAALRVHVRAFTAEDIRFSYDKASNINENAVRAAKAKRILDRILGYCLHDDTDPWRMSVGRVVSPLVASLKHQPAEVAVVRKRLPGGWNAVVRLNSTRSKDVNLVTMALHALQPPTLQVDSVEDVEHVHKPLTGPEALLLCVRSLDRAPGEVQASIQRNYERGRLSYPRTDSRTMGVVARKWIERASGSAGTAFDPVLLEQRQAERLERSYDAHEALLPVGHEWAADSIPDSHLSVDEAVLRTIARHSLQIGAPAEVYTREFGKLAADPVSQKWRTTLGSWYSGLTFVRDKDEHGFVQDPLRHEFTRTPTIQGDVSSWVKSPEHLVIERMVAMGLGRPSTLLSLSQKTVGHYLKADGTVNGRGSLMMKKVGSLLPQLLQTDIAAALEKTVVELGDDLSIGQRLVQAWGLLGNNERLNGGAETAGSKTVVIGENTHEKRQDTFDFSSI